MKVLVAKRVVYDRETLFDQVWEEPIVKDAEKYGVSDVMIHNMPQNIADSHQEKPRPRQCAIIRACRTQASH